MREDAQTGEDRLSKTVARNSGTGQAGKSERRSAQPGPFRVVAASKTISVGGGEKSERNKRAGASGESGAFVGGEKKAKNGFNGAVEGNDSVKSAISGVSAGWEKTPVGECSAVSGVSAGWEKPSVGERSAVSGASVKLAESANLVESADSSDLMGASETGDDEFDDENAFFASFSSGGEERRGTDSFDAAFAGGLRSIFDAESEEDENAEGAEESDESDAERFQRDFERERRESLDGVLLQNDADFLREAGEKYERSRVSDADFERKSASRTGQIGSSSGCKSGNESDGRNGENGENRGNRGNRGNGTSGENGGSGEGRETPERRRVPIGPASILEAMLFVGDRENRPLTLARATELMRNVSETEAIEALADLNERYWRDGAPYRIVRDGDGFRMALRPEFDALAARMVGGKTKEFKLTQTMIDVLALIAYRQPISLDEILETRNNATGALSQLVKRELVAQEKRVVDKKKVAFYSTTPRFLRLFNLESLDDLPIVGDVDYR